MRKILAFTLIFTVASGVSLLTDTQANAGALTQSYIRLNRMTAATGTNLRLVFKTASAGATSVVVNMNGADSTSWTTSSGAVTNGALTTSVATCPTEATATALPGAFTTTGATAGTITFGSVTALAAATTYCVDVTSASAVTTAAAGEYHPTITAGTDSATVAVRTISNDSVVVNATVTPTFNFALSGNTDNFTTKLSSASTVDTTGVTATVNTNAKTGWIAWAKDSNTGLTSASQTKTIASTTPGTAATIASPTEGYVMGITAITQGSGAGVTSAATAYDGSGGAGKGSGLDTNIRQIAQSNGTANGAVLTIKERAAISAVTPAAADYTDTITLIAAGSF